MFTLSQTRTAYLLSAPCFPKDPQPFYQVLICFCMLFLTTYKMCLLSMPLHLLLLNSQIVLTSSEGRTTFPLCCWPSLHTQHGQDHVGCFSVFISSPASSSSRGQQRWCCTRHSTVPRSRESRFQGRHPHCLFQMPQSPRIRSF